MLPRDSLFSDTIWAIIFAMIVATVIMVVLIGFVALPIGIAGLIAVKMYNSSGNQERRAQKHTQALYELVVRNMPDLPDQAMLLDQIERDLPRDVPEDLRRVLLGVAEDILAQDPLSDGRPPPPPPICNSIEGAKYRDHLSRYAQKVHHPDVSDTAVLLISYALRDWLAEMPAIATEGASFAEVRALDLIEDKCTAVEALIGPFLSQEAEELSLFEDLRRDLMDNLARVSGIQPSKLHYSERQIIYPDSYDGDDPIRDYLGGTVLEEIFEAPVPFRIPPTKRFEHHHIVAGSGHGKTQTLQYLIARDLDLVAAGEASVIVIDGQGDLIRTISGLAGC